MTFRLLPPDLVKAIQDDVLNPGELHGRALDKSLEGALARVDYRLAYGMIGDIFGLAATYSVVIATGHYFNDGNMRTAFCTMQLCLDLNGYRLDYGAIETGQLIIRVAQGFADEEALAAWLRQKAGA
jgi:death on curing protein